MLLGTGRHNATDGESTRGHGTDNVHKASLEGGLQVLSRGAFADPSTLLSKNALIGFRVWGLGFRV